MAEDTEAEAAPRAPVAKIERMHPDPAASLHEGLTTAITINSLGVTRNDDLPPTAAYWTPERKNAFSAAQSGLLGWQNREVSIGEELLEARRRHRQAGDPRLTDADRALLRGLTSKDLQGARPPWTQ